MINETGIIKLPNVLLISGSGRNTGKTTTACGIISEISGFNEVISIKVSPHFHPLTDSLKILMEIPGLVISEEKNGNSHKDSSRFLKAGASKSYYMQGSDEQMPYLAEWINRNISGNTPVICESAGLGKYIEPGCAIYICSGINKKNPEWNFSYKSIELNPKTGKIEMSVKWENNSWKI